MRRILARAVLSVGTVALVLTAAASAHAHGLAGKRFFPSTLTIDDPFVADELSLPTVFHIKEPRDGETPARQNTTVSGEFSKRILPNLGLTFGGDWTLLDPAANGKTESGFGNLELTLKYQFFTSAEHETIFSVAFGWEAGGTGRAKIGAESFDVFKPALLFGKGFGDLPNALAWLKPLAVTGIVEGVLPSRSGNKTFMLNDDGDLEIVTEQATGSLQAEQPAAKDDGSLAVFGVGADGGAVVESAENEDALLLRSFQGRHERP